MCILTWLNIRIADFSSSALSKFIKEIFFVKVKHAVLIRGEERSIEPPLLLTSSERKCRQLFKTIPWATGRVRWINVKTAQFFHLEHLTWNQSWLSKPLTGGTTSIPDPSVTWEFTRADDWKLFKNRIDRSLKMKMLINAYSISPAETLLLFLWQVSLYRGVVQRYGW